MGARRRCCCECYTFRDDFDRASHRIRLQGVSPRAIELPEPVWSALDQSSNAPGARLLSDESRAAPTAEDIALEIFYAAHDAGIVRPSEVTPDALRHSYLAFLVGGAGGEGQAGDLDEAGVAVKVS